MLILDLLKEHVKVVPVAKGHCDDNISVQLLDLSEKNMEPSNNDGIVAVMNSILGLLSSETERATALRPVDTQHLSSFPVSACSWL